MDEKVALFDLDGTLADYDGQLRRELLETKSRHEKLPKDFHSGKLPQWLTYRTDLIKSQEGWWANLPVIESGISLLKLCANIGFDVYILTQGPKRTKKAWTEKFMWCDRHIEPIAPDYGISITRNGKGLHYGRVLVDDYPPYMLDWLEHRPRGLGLMPASPSNKGFRHLQVIRYNPAADKWWSQQLEDRLRQAFERAGGEP
jgi:5'-nucleotidase